MSKGNHELRALRHDSDDESGEGSFLADGKEVAQPEERIPWGNRVQFLLAIIGYTVGIGSIWRFPTLCARNGGGAFLIPFFFFMITSGGPLYYLEVCLGQFTGRGAGATFEFCPLFKGLGMMMVTLSTLFIWYYMTINAWTLYYLFNSFKSELPWGTCGNWWNTPQCVASYGETRMIYNSTENTTVAANITTYNISSIETTLHNLSLHPVLERSSEEEFWRFNVLRMSDGLETMGTIQWHLVIGHAISYLVVILAVIKGTRSLGKVVYVTATLPYLLLTILLIRGLTLDGAFEGVMYYITPDFEKLLTLQVWLEAAVQVFFSLGPSWGSVITMASFNKFHQKSYRETILVVAADCFTAFYCGLVVFTIIGFMAHEAGVPVDEIAKSSGHGLAFIAYPTACSQMPFPQLWAVLFFLTLFSLALDTDFGGFETVIVGILDWFPRLHKRRSWVVVSVGLFLFLLSLPILTNGGIYLFTVGDWYLSAFALFVGSISECVAVGWIYGADRFSKDILFMTGRDVSVLLRFFWMLFIPVSLLLCFVASLSQYSAPTLDSYRFQPYAIGLGFFLGLLPVAVQLGIGLMEVLKAKGGLKQRLLHVIRPTKYWGPNDAKARSMYLSQPCQDRKPFLARLKLNFFGDKNTPWI